MNTENIQRYLNSFGQEVVDGAKKQLRKNKKGGGNLDKSISFYLVETDGKFTIRFFMADYGTFVDKGVRGQGGTIKSGEHKGTWGGKRFYQTWEGKRKQSPYQFGSGKSSGSIYKGIEDFIKKKGIKGRDKKGRFITNKSLMFAMTKVLWTKGIHGISFFQKPLGLALKKFNEGLLQGVKEDIINNLTIK